MQFFLANLYTERLIGAAPTAAEHTAPSAATATADDHARLPEPVLAGSR